MYCVTLNVKYEHCYKFRHDFFINHQGGGGALTSQLDEGGWKPDHKNVLNWNNAHAAPPYAYKSSPHHAPDGRRLQAH